MKDKHWVATICYFIGNVTWHHSCLTVAPAEIWSQQFQVLHMSSMGLWISRCKLQHNIFATLWLMARFQSPARTLGLTSVYIFFVWGGGDTMKTIPNLASITLHGFPPWPIARHARWTCTWWGSRVTGNICISSFRWLEIHIQKRQG